jgi:hypothetical protein
MLEACRTLLARTDVAQPDEVVGPEIEDAIEQVRRLDAHHLARTAALDDEVFARVDPAGRPSLARHREQLGRELAPCEAVLVAGGHVGILLNRLRLFGVLELSDPRPIVAWSGGAMALAERVVLFHDSPPQGPGDPEVYARGMGLVRGVVPLPHAAERLRLEDPARVALLARRFAPEACVPLDAGDRLEGSSSSSSWVGGQDGRRLERDGSVAGQRATGAAVTEVGA